MNICSAIEKVLIRDHPGQDPTSHHYLVEQLYRSIRINYRDSIQVFRWPDYQDSKVPRIFGVLYVKLRHTRSKLINLEQSQMHVH